MVNGDILTKKASIFGSRRNEQGEGKDDVTVGNRGDILYCFCQEKK
jgi:hypothetical protein